MSNTIHFLIGYTVGSGVMLAIAILSTQPNSSIIKAGHAEYNNTTGDFQFLPACNKEK